MPIDHPTEEALGLEITDEGFYAVALSFKKEGISITKKLKLPNVKPIDSEELLNLIQSHQVVTSLDESLLVRQIELPIVKESAIETALPLQLESILPYPAEEAVIERQTIRKTEKETFLNTFAIKKESLEKHLNLYRSYGIDPEVVSMTPIALAHFTAYIKKSNDPILTLHLGKKIHLIASMGTTLLASFTTDDPKEIKKGILAIKKKCPYSFGEKIFTLGEPPVILPKELPLEFFEERDLQPFAIAIGLALSALPKQGGINFLKGEFSFKHPLKRLRKTLALYFTSCIVLSASLFFFGYHYLAYKQDELKVALASALNEKVDQPKDISNFSLEEIQQEIYSWQKSIQATPNLFALHPNLPRVSDLLAWLSTHPNVVFSQDGESGKLELQHLNYSMVKRPEQSRKDEKYQAKVELEFTADIPRLAREFHDALIAPNDFVDPKGEIKWSTSRGAYKTSFYLKDRTFYP